MGDTWSIQALSEALMRLLPNLGKQIAAHLRESGEEETTLMQMSVLHQINKQSITASELAKRRRVSLQSASVLVQSMAERGWIVRRRDSHDRRQFLLEITPEGAAKAEATRNEIISYLAEFLGDLSSEEIAAAQIFLPALSRILTQDTATDDTEAETQRTLQEEQTPL
ncbi:MAG: MarR family transcriptional regulator [Chloroflexota bacterium]